MHRRIVVHILVAAILAPIAAVALAGPYQGQIAENVAKLEDGSASVRAGAVEALGFLRAYAAEAPIVQRLGDDSPLVRRQAAMALGWCGTRDSLAPLIDALDDRDWLTRQAAHVALTNLTGREFPFDSTATPEKRTAQAGQWRRWWATVPADRPPEEVLKMLSRGKWLSAGGHVTASSTYRGPPHVLVDGNIGPEYWQTKNVPPPQWCVIDLGKIEQVGSVTVHQYGPAFVMTEYELATSLDGKKFDVVRRQKGRTPVDLTVTFPKRKARHIRITSFGSARPIYPTTFFEVTINGAAAGNTAKNAKPAPMSAEQSAWRTQRGLRALGALGGKGATEAVLEMLGQNPPVDKRSVPTVRAAIRALGRLQEPAGFEALVRLLGNTMYARDAAEALGDFQDRRAVAHLTEAYPKYAKNLAGKNPKAIPRDDRMGFPSEDRMLETPYAIIFALCRLPLDDPKDLAELRKIAPLVMANLPGDHDTFMLYEPEVGHLLTRYLLNKADMRQEACEHAFRALGQPGRAPIPPLQKWSPLGAQRLSAWLPCVCTEQEDLPRLLPLLKHKNGWVRLNAAKTIAWLGDKKAIEPLANILKASKAEADFGYSGTFKDEEYNDPAPRWREGLVRALGLLGAHQHTDLIAKILHDERSVAEIRHAAASALVDLANDEALDILRETATKHPIHCIRHVARDALREHGLSPAPVVPSTRAAVENQPAAPAEPSSATTLRDIEALVFIKGGNNIPNTIGTVEQADRWRQTYVVTDSGPVYRPGRNLYVLSPPKPDGKVTPLTTFKDGYVGEPELSFDGRQVIFTHRGQDNPWWHVWRINVDGTDLRQLTFGPYHDVGPAYLPDGRIVLSSSRSGIRDEYHGYPCTALCVMNSDGSGIRPIATNIGRDNEPALMNDGRIVFSRLEVFYSRNKTELTLHAAHPDGTQDMVLYGPERRKFWRELDHGPRTPADPQEAPLTHRVLRMTQPQPMPDGRHIIVTTQAGLVLVGPHRDREQLITPDYKTRAYTTPMPLPDGTVLCATALKQSDRTKIDLGLYLFDPAGKRLELVYNDPSTADFEARPIMARRPPMPRADKTTPGTYSGLFVCTSVFNTREPEVAQRGRLVRLIEGMPVIARHSTHTNPNPVWQNHGGTFARVLGTVPLAPDGSFNVVVPADRLLHFQVLDSDREVVGNQLTWIYPRPGEMRSCVGCHERLHTTTGRKRPQAAHHPPVEFLPSGDEFTYRAKAWFKGHLPAEIERRTRTVRSVNLLGR